MESWSRAVFLALKAPEHPAPGLVRVATTIAQRAIFIVPLLLAALWLWGGREDRSGLLLAFCGAEVALGFNQIAAAIWFHPRPLAVPIGRTLIDHAADSSFPSDHVTFLMAVGLGLLGWSSHRWAGIFTLALALPLAWARLFLGVHFRLDMVGAIPVAYAGLLVAMPFRTWADTTLTRRWIEPLYRRIFSVPIRQRWVEA